MESLEEYGIHLPISETALGYIIVVVLLALGGLLTKNTSPYSRAGGSKYERRRMRRNAGIMLMIAGIMLLGMTILVQVLSYNP